jgi:hypothetical protein
MHADDARQWRAEKFPVAQGRGRVTRRILTSDTHRSVNFSAEVAPVVLERLGAVNIGRPALGLVEQRGDESISACSGREDYVPWLDV